MVLDSIRSQGKLDAALETRILAADSKARLEDIYLPFKPKRRTKAMIARENGLEPLADALLGDPTLDPTATAADYVTENVPDAAAALEGARAILVERFSEDADLIGGLRERMWNRGPTRLHRPRGQGDRRREVRRLLRLLRAVHQAALAPDSRRVPRGEGGDPRRHPRPGRRFGLRRPGHRLRAHHRRRGRHPRRGPRRRQVAHPGGALDVAHADPARPAGRPARAAAHRRRGGGDRRLRGEPARPAARRPGRHPRDDGPGPGPAHRRQGRGRRRHGQGRRHRHDLPARAAPRLERRAGDPDQARRRARRRPDRDRQRHGVAGDGQAGRRAGRGQPGAEDDEGDGQRGRGVGVLRVGVRVGRAARPRRLAARRRVDRPAPAGPARRARQDRPEVDRRRASTSTTCPSRRCRARWTPSSRTR